MNNNQQDESLIMSIATSSPASPMEEALELSTQEVELLTVEGMKDEMEDAIVRTTMGLLKDDNIAPKDRLSAVDKASELIGLKQRPVNLINQGNMQLNQLTERTSRHLLGAGGALKTLGQAKAETIDVKPEEVTVVTND